MEKFSSEESTKGRFAAKLGRYITEVIVIFIGITISFLFDQWRENRQNVKKEIAYVSSLITDLKNKASELQESDFVGATLLTQNSDSLFACYYNNKGITDQLASFFVREYASRWFFDRTTPTYRSSSATGEWQELPDSLRRKIYDLYELKFRELELRYGTANQLKEHFMNSYLIEKGAVRLLGIKSLQGVEMVPPDNEEIKKLLLTKEFLNNLSVLRTYAKSNRNLHQSIIAEIKMVVLDLESYVKKLR